MTVMSSAGGSAVALSAGGSAAVEFQGIRRSYGGTHALAGLDLALAPGELLALLGPSGCGKTTALRLLAGFDRPTEGRVLIDGRDVTDVPASRRDTGMVFQAYSLFPTMTAAENVAFGLRMRRVASAEREARADELLELVGLGERGGSYPHQLSGGQQQRVALARALAVAPSVLLLDEPLSALDARVRVQLRDEIRRLQLAEGITTLFVTHDQSEALAIADRVAVLNAGRLEQVAPPQEIYASPATTFVAEFVGVVNRLAAVPDGPGRVRVLGASTELDGPAGSGTVLVRPEALTVGSEGPGEPGTVVTRTFLGAVTRLVVATDAGEVTVDAVTRPGLPQHRASARWSASTPERVRAAVGLRRTVGGRCFNPGMLLAEVVACSAAVGATRARTAKAAALAALLRAAAPGEIEPATAWLTGEPRQGRLGAGWRTLAALGVPPAASPSLEVADVEARLDALAATSGAGSTARRAGAARRPVRRGDGRRAAVPAAAVHRRAAPGRAGGRDAGGRGRRRRDPGGHGAPGVLPLRPPPRDGPARPHRRRRRAGSGGARGRPPGPAHAGEPRREPGRRARRARAPRQRRVQAGRRAHPGAPRRATWSACGRARCAR